jgi:molybdopterin-guanine dinucleotide biosynthesis protein B
MRVFGLAGWSGSGKTTLLARLIPELGRRGISVSTLKHAHHAFDIDHPGKDSHVHRMAGAREVMVASARRWALIRELREEAEPRPEALLARMSPVDLVLVEGFKRHSHDKLEVWRPDLAKPLLAPEDPHIVAVATTGGAGAAALGLGVPLLDLDDVPAIATFILRHCGLGDGGA